MKPEHTLISPRTQTGRPKSTAKASISHSKSTVVTFRIEKALHYVAVQIVITPFKIDDHPEQVFFSAAYRYSYCCDAFRPLDNHLIEHHVQIVYDLYFKPCPWDFSSKHCLIKPAETCTRMSTCRDAVDKRIEEYMSRESGAGIDGAHPYDVYELEHCLDDTFSERPIGKPSGCAITEAAANLAARVQQGLKTLKRGSPDSSVVGNSDNKYQDLAQLEIDLWIHSETIDLHQQPNRWELYWNFKILASNILLYRQFQSIIEIGTPAGESNVSTKTRLRWRDTASMVNMLVAGLWPTWENKANLLFEVIAKNQYGFKTFARLPRRDYLRMVEKAIAILKDGTLPVAEPLMLYHPAWLINSWTQMDITMLCRGLQLPIVDKAGKSLDMRPSEVGNCSYPPSSRLETDQALYRTLSDIPLDS